MCGLSAQKGIFIMKICVIKYRLRKYDRFMYSMRVHIISPEKAIRMAGVQDAYEHSITECTHPYKMGSRYYSAKLGTYNATWLTQEGRTAYNGNYCPENGSYCLYYGNTCIAEGKWNDDKFETFGYYNYSDVRRAVQFGLV